MKKKWVISEDDYECINKLATNNFYLIERILKKENYDKTYEEDIIQDCFVALIELITKYKRECKVGYLSTYVQNRLPNIIKNIIKKYDVIYTDDLPSGDLTYKDDFVYEIEKNMYAKHLEKFIFNTNYFTFMQKTTLMAKLGFLNNLVLTDQELGSMFNCSRNNFYIKFMDSKSKLRRAVSSKENESNYEYHYDLFSYFNTAKEIVLNVIKENLNNDEVNLLKLVWSDDFSHLKDFNEIDITDEEVISYYNVIAKLYNIIINVDVWEQMIKTGIDYGYALRK